MGFTVFRILLFMYPVQPFIKGHTNLPSFFQRLVRPVVNVSVIRDNYFPLMIIAAFMPPASGGDVLRVRPGR